jgi:DNA-directed RNA polymerase subunit RPC12/RpoP
VTDVDCPYCGAGIEICHDDGFGYAEDVLHEYECHACEKHFTFTTTITFYYEARKADCLNDGDHDYQETATIPRKYAKLRCATCGDEKPLPKDQSHDR